MLLELARNLLDLTNTRKKNSSFWATNACILALFQRTHHYKWRDTLQHTPRQPRRSSTATCRPATKPISPPMHTSTWLYTRRHNAHAHTSAALPHAHVAANSTAPAFVSHSLERKTCSCMHTCMCNNRRLTPLTNSRDGRTAASLHTAWTRRTRQHEHIMQHMQ
jgi:hypothetical protein